MATGPSGPGAKTQLLMLSPRQKFSEAIASLAADKVFLRGCLKLVMIFTLVRLARVIEANGGHVARYQGDGFKAVFGLPTARESDPGAERP